jgi:CubicO group peptidase (beta-lactamase class C family)
MINLGSPHFRGLKIYTTLFCVVGLALFVTLDARRVLSQAAHSAQSAPAPSTPAKPSASPAPNSPELTAPDVAAFLAGLVPLQIEKADIAGAVVAIVKDGKVLYASGYGYADAEKKKPVTADATLFRIGSISKLFTWTAAMQQVEQGKLDLDRDVNDYIDFKIPQTFGKPVTLHNLMTHTPGFEEVVKDLFVAEPGDHLPLGVYLPTHLPNQIFPPGTTPAYSNYGATLAGYLVQRVSGQPFDDYVAEHIFKPLGMTRITFVQPLPDSLKPLMSNGYAKASDGSKPFELVNAEPAGSVAAAALDMTRFMIAHLQDGQLGDARILKPETARLMHSRQFAMDPAANAMCLGFYEETRNGHRIIGHGGDTQYFHSDLHLILDSGVGFFVSYNSAGKGDGSPRTELWEKFLDRYFPYTPPAEQTLASAAADARSVRGSYLPSRRSLTTIFKMFSLLGQLSVAPGKDGTIIIDQLKDPNGQPKRWREIGAGIYRDVNGQDQLIFKRDTLGRFVVVPAYPFFVFERVTGPQNGRVVLFVLIGSIAVIALALLLWPVAALVRRHFRQPLQLNPRERRLRLLVRLVCALDILLVVGWAILLTTAQRNIAMLTSRADGWFRLLQILALLAAAGTLVYLYNLYKSWSGDSRWFWTKLVDGMLALASLGFLWIIWIGNLLHFSLKF